MELKKCPFCGEPPQMRGGIVYCMNPVCKIYHINFGETEWNDRSPAEQKWISVKERLPEDNVDVLVSYYDGGNYFTTIAGYGVPEKEWWCIEGGRLFTITHWQPLPEPPEVL